MTSDLFDLTGKVALVTGSSRGIGKAIAAAMVHYGARVVISGRKAEACESTARAINGALEDASGSATAIAAHVGDKEQLQRLVDSTHGRLGPIDVLVCNAAVNPFYGSAMDIPDSAFEKVMSVNIDSNHWLCNMVLPEMIERRSGSIIITSSINALKGNPMTGAYAISKAANLQMVRNLAVEFGPSNVRVNAISPGLVRTEFARALWEDPEILKNVTRRHPLRRIGEPKEIAGIAVFLASNAGSFATGQNFVIDGGATIV